MKTVTAPNPQTVILKLKHAYNPNWFTQTQLAQIFPLPQHVWDKTSASSPVGNYDQTTAGAKAVRNFLDSQAHNLGAYATNPLWQVVDGPWKLSQFRTDGYAQFSPNPKYSGKKPALSKFVMEPFTSETAEFDVLRSGGLSYGFVPLTDLSQKALLEQQGYKIVAWPSWSISYIVINFNNPTVGPIFRQLYVRQAMQELVDQPGYIKAFLKGNGVTTNGPVPAQPVSSYASPQLKAGFYHFSPSSAVSLLRSHGWDVKPNGTSTCAKPGSGPGECGSGIEAGAPLSFKLQYLSGVTYLNQEITTWKSALLQAGHRAEPQPGIGRAGRRHRHRVQARAELRLADGAVGVAVLDLAERLPLGRGDLRHRGRGERGQLLQPDQRRQHRRGRDVQQPRGLRHLRELSREAAAGAVAAQHLQPDFGDQDQPGRSRPAEPAAVREPRVVVVHEVTRGPR